MRDDADRSFGNGSTVSNPFTDAPAGRESGSPERDAQAELPGLVPREVNDLVVDCGNGDEESVAYHLYTGTSLRRKATVLVARFATRTVLVEGQRLKAYRDAIASRRCAELRISSRVERMNAETSRAPVIERLQVVTPRQGEELLAAELEEQPLLSPAPEQNL